MENVNDFMEQQILNLVNDFKNIKASIHFEPLINAYYVEIKPKRFLSDSTALKSRRMEIQDEFYEHNFNATLIFVAEDSLLELNSFNSTFTGMNYVQTASLNCLTR